MKTSNLIKGLHHVTATVDDAREDYDFYTRLLGLRLVKQTVNFDNNRVYHFYYGNAEGAPGTIMTTFPYKGEGVRRGRLGTGQISITSFSVPSGSLAFWEKRLSSHDVAVERRVKFNGPVLQFSDPSGLVLEIVGHDEDERIPWTTNEVVEENAIRGFSSVTLSVSEVDATFDFLLRVFGFEKIATDGPLTRFAVNGGGPGHFWDIRNDAGGDKGVNGIGTVHHVAWRVENDEALLTMRKALTEEWNFKVTEVKDRNYFHSIYFRIPGGVLFEVATIPPGFTADETIESLGGELKLPAWEEKNRKEIEAHLPSFK